MQSFDAFRKVSGRRSEAVHDTSKTEPEQGNKFLCYAQKNMENLSRIRLNTKV